jgi:3-hydroxy-9,10-secoandrosta-1,3,5(10)-triene-9,17-dione monooxygenase
MSDPPSRSEASTQLVERARALTPLLAEHAAEAERLRRPVDAVISALVEAGIFELMVPRCYGGLELDLGSFLDVGLALGEGDASQAWVATFYIEHCWMLCQFPETFQRELFSDRSHVLAPAMLAPRGKALREPGGYRLSGRWEWGTGVMHAEWMIAGALVEYPGGGPDPRFFALPASAAKVEDTWYVDGMIGTGSNDVVIEDVLVPEERSVSILEMSAGRAPGSRIHSGPLYRTPMVPILGLAASMPALGQARVAVRGFRDRVRERIPLGSTERQGKKAAAQMRLARVELEVQQAELMMRQVVAEVCACRDRATLEERARWVAALALVVHQSRDVIQTVADASGAHAHFQSHPLQRALRDVNALSCHAVFDLDARLETLGRLRLGLEAPGAMI